VRGLALAAFIVLEVRADKAAARSLRELQKSPIEVGDTVIPK
jgi:hypothetical protein